MQINNIKINNFKFHTKLDFPLNGNMLLYGENGTGKSSIYWALHSLFKKEQTKNIENYKKRNSQDDMFVEAIFNENAQENITTSSDNTFSNANFNTIYFTNQDLLESIIDYDSNFYIVLDIQLKKYFPMLGEYYTSFSKLDEEVKHTDDRTEQELLINKRKRNIQQFEEKLKNAQDIANDILHDNLDEKNTTITFDYQWGSLNEGATSFHQPIISLQIDSIKDIKQHFNEAKLKLTSICIFFALVKLQSQDSLDNSFKLLVLDDFLTSLDMANRKLITQYILSEFKEYQKIILTHNLQFFNLIKLLANDWDIKKLFLLKESSEYKTYIKSQQNYINEAKIFIETKQYDLEIAGNKLRKAFEEIVQEFEQQLELGKVESFHKIISSLKNNDTIFFNEPHKEINRLFVTLTKILNCNKNDTQKIKIVEDILTKKKEKNTIEIAQEDNTTLKYLVNKANIYKNILLNPSSHNDIQSELYHKECTSAIELLEQLDKLLSKIKGNN